MRIVAIASVLTVVLLTGGAPGLVQPAGDDLLIVPGQRIGPLAVGMSIADATKIFGTPQPAITKIIATVLPAPEGAMSFRWEPSAEAKRQGARVQGFHAVTDKAGTIYEVQSPFDPRYHTPEGLHIGSKVTDITAALGAPSRQMTVETERY